MNTVYICLSVSEHLLCPESLALREVFYYNSVGDLRRRSCATPRAALQNALMRPYTYLKVGTVSVASSKTFLFSNQSLCFECSRDILPVHSVSRCFTLLVSLIAKSAG